MFAEDAKHSTAQFSSLPVGAVYHAAGVQVEARLLTQTVTTMRRVMAPKSTATCRSLLLTRPHPTLEHVLFSSVSSITGNANHANYAGVNASLDALAAHHVATGASVVAFQWGAWSSIGMVHRNYRISNRQAAAMGMLSSEAGLSVMHAALGALDAVVPPSPIIGAVPRKYWTNLLQNVPGGVVPPIFSSFEVQKKEALTNTTMRPGQRQQQQHQGGVDVESTVRQVASSVLGTSDVELDASQPLALQGLDSLAGLELRQKLQDALGIDLALLAEDPQGATINSIVEEATSRIAASPITTTSRSSGNTTTTTNGVGNAMVGTSTTALVSLQSQQQQHQPAPKQWISPTPVTIKMRLFCLPWAGGMSENLFARWSMMLPASIQVCPVEIPGRGRREGEEAIQTVEELAKLLAHSLPLHDKPYVIFGTCLGAIVGYEIIREVEKTKSAPLPVGFMPAAVSPPHVYASVVMKIYMQRRLMPWEKPPLEEVMKTLRGWKDMPREKLLLAFEAGHFAGVEEMKKNERLFNRVAPMGVNDIMMAVQYRYDRSLGPLSIPIIAFDGTKDNTIPRGYMKGWRKHTRARYRHVKVQGTHYFVSTHYKPVTAEVGSEMLGWMEQVTKGGVLGAGHSWIRSSSADAEHRGPDQSASTSATAMEEKEGRKRGIIPSVLMYDDAHGHMSKMVTMFAVVLLIWYYLLKFSFTLE